MSEVLKIENAGAVRKLVLNRPDKRNALNAELVASLTSEVRKAATDSHVRVIAISGEGADFCAGADLSEIRSLADRDALENLDDADRLADLFLAIRQAPKPVVALVRGRALAGGCGLATACDLVVAETSAQFGYPEVQIGFVPAMVMAILRRNVPEKVAFELVTLGHRIDADDAARWGLVNRLFAPDSFEAGAEELLEELASRDQDAVRIIKRLLYRQDGMTFEEAMRAGAEVNVIARSTEGAQEGIARFLGRNSRAD